MKIPVVNGNKLYNLTVGDGFPDVPLNQTSGVTGRQGCRPLHNLPSKIDKNYKQ